MAAADVKTEEFVRPIMDRVDATKTLAYVIAGHAPAKTTFVTPNEANPQIGFIVYPKGHTIPRHYHNPVERTVYGTPEVLIIRSGRVRADIYDTAHELQESVELGAGQVLVLVGGGHGFEILEEGTIMMEVKQGPYVDKNTDKVQF